MTCDSSGENWPPRFSIRISPKARYARLRVLPHTGLEVVLPRGMDESKAIGIVENHRDWICKTLDRVCANIPPPSMPSLPQEIALHGGSVRLAVRYGQGKTLETKTTLDLCALENSLLAVFELQAWARGYATRVTGREVATLAAEHDLPVRGLRFRRQKSRWGSCSAKKTLSLNTCLIFLPPELARHVIRHELAHTRHLDHGQGFWKTLFAMSPDALALDRRLRSAWKYVPAWMWLREVS